MCPWAHRFQMSISHVFCYPSLPYSLKHGLPLNIEFARPAGLDDQSSPKVLLFLSMYHLNYRYASLSGRHASLTNSPNPEDIGIEMSQKGN